MGKMILNGKEYAGSNMQRFYFVVHGQIVKSSTQNTSGIGAASIEISNGIARIDFSFIILNASGTSDDFTWGISIEKLKELNPNIPNIVPMEGGYYFTNQNNNSELIGNGSLFTPTLNELFWMPARLYTSSGADVGGWPSNMIRSNGFWFGSCFGKVLS